jgi:hypothetical protein
VRQAEQGHHARGIVLRTIILIGLVGAHCA